MDNKLKNLIENNILMIKSPPNSEIRNPNLPIKESPGVYRILAHLIGDGSGHKTHTPYYCNSCEELRKQFIKDLSLFGEMSINEVKLNPTPAINFPSVLKNLLIHFFDVEFTNPNRIPPRIWNTNKTNKAEFLKALYDDEGTISPRLGIAMKNKKLLGEIKNLIDSLGIKTLSIIMKKGVNNYIDWKFNIKLDSYNDFYETLGFYHPQKQKNLEILLKIRELSKDNIHKLNNPKSAKRLRKNIINALSKNSYSIMELSRLILVDYHRLYKNMRVMEKQGIIYKSGPNNKIKWKTKF